MEGPAILTNIYIIQGVFQPSHTVSLARIAKTAQHLQLRPIRELAKSVLGMTKLSKSEILHNFLVLLTLRFRGRAKVFVYLAPFDWRMVLVQLFCGSHHDFVVVTSQLYWDERATYKLKSRLVERAWTKMVARSSFVGLNDVAFDNAPSGFLQKHLIYHTVTPEPVRPAYKTKSVVIGYAGRLVEEKGVLDLLAAAARFPSYEFHFAGWGPLKDLLLRNEADNVVFHGKLASSDLYAFYASCDYITQLSVQKVMGESTWQDVFGLSVAEALCFGCRPIISGLPAPVAVFSRLAPDDTQIVQLQNNRVPSCGLDAILAECTKKSSSFRIPEYINDDKNQEKWRRLIT